MTTEQRAVLNAAFRIGSALGRKFEATDMTIELRQAAHLYAATYEGDFEYMVGMRQEVTGGRMFFSDGQSKGILNCLMADARKRLTDNRKHPRINPETGVEETPEELLQLAEDTRPTAQPRPAYMNADGTLDFGARKALGRDRTYSEIFGANG